MVKNVHFQTDQKCRYFESWLSVPDKMWDQLVQTADNAVTALAKKNFPADRHVIGVAIVDYAMLVMDVVWAPEARAVIGGKGHRRLVHFD
jgi:hypothetical protein